MTPEQKEIMVFVIHQGGSVTKKQVVSAFGRQYYCNGEKHVGDRLSRMVKSGLLIRIKPGVFEAGKGKKNKPSNISKEQLSIF